MATRALTNNAVTALTAALGGMVHSDAATCDFYGHDVFSRGVPPLAVIRPTDTASLATAVRIATSHGCAIIPRGGGMSYTGGYVPPQAGAVVIDTAGMDRILNINAEDMTVTVEAGVTWAQLYAALQPLKLRPPFWGTLSGVNATVGGGMSQNGLFWGSGRYGTAADSALKFDVVLADGSVLSTGSDFFRPFGPDLTGLFAADTGAFGIKATITLRLIAEASHFAFGSFGFDRHEQMLAAMAAVARAGLASEGFGFDPFLQAQRLQRESLATDAKALLGVMKAQGSVFGALKEGAKVVAAGRSFLDGVPFSSHYTAEGRNQAAVDADMAEITRLVTAAGGKIVDNTIPKVMRANPFPPVNSMLGPKGERWVPVHGVVPHSKAVSTFEAIGALYARNAEAMAEHGIGAGYMFAIAGSTGVLLEPVFFWPDETLPLHAASVEAAHFAKLPRHPANPAARAVVETLRRGLIDLFHDAGAIHLQIARTYRWLDRLDPAARGLVDAVKLQVDPQGLMNPGSLGLT